MTTDIHIIGLNHTTAPVAVLERVAHQASQKGRMLDDLSSFLDEVVVLSTCNRAEFIYVPKDEHSHSRTEAYIRDTGRLTAEEYDRHIYRFRGVDAVRHLYRVAAGLDSMVPGETQIMGQFKSAFQLALDGGHARAHFQQIYQRTLNAARTVRREFKLNSGAVSISSLAVLLARQVFSDLNTRTVLLVGAGKMGEQACAYLSDAGVGKILVANRSPERAAALAASVSGQPVDLASLNEALDRADIVVTAAAVDEPLITVDMVRDAQRRRPEHAMFFIDIAVPRNVDPRVNDLPDVYVYNIDDLQTLVDSNIKARGNIAALAEKRIEEKLRQHMGLNADTDAAPVIQSVESRVGRIRNAELETLFRQNPDWSEADRDCIEQAMDNTVNKILHEPILSPNQATDSEDDESSHRPRSAIEVFKDFFNLG